MSVGIRLFRIFNLSLSTKTNSMRSFLNTGFFISCLVVSGFHGAAQDNPVVFKGALIYPVTGSPIDKGILVVQGGKIVAGGDGSPPVPANAVVVDVSGKVIIPGIVDTHSHIGSPEGGDNSNALNPEVRVLDAVNPASNGFKKALAGG